MSDETPKRLTPEELAEIARREKAATPGPWKYEPDMERGSMGWIVHENKILFPVCGDSAQQYLNALFCAHAREDIPNLLAHAAALEAELDRMRAAIARLAAFIEKDIVQGDAPTIEQGEEWVRRLRAEAQR